MKWLKKGALGLTILAAVILLAVLVLLNPFGPSALNTYAKEGELKLAGLKQPVAVWRDEKGMAYIHAEDSDDLVFAQGFVMAQDRLFQMELIKMMATGRIGELIGEQARDLDIRMRTLGFHRQAGKHFLLLNSESKRFLQRFVEGVNAMITARPRDIHLEFKLAGIRPTLWTPEESLAILYYMGWNSAGNLQNEIISQALVEKLGFERAAQIFPLNLNPAEAGASGKPPNHSSSAPAAFLGEGHLARLLALTQDKTLQVGSNNWVVAPARSASGKPILANDPHLEASMLPGPWYPCGLIAPGLRAVGVTIPGMPGLAIGRTEYLAFGVTNAYGDAQDLYVETVDPADPGRYLEGVRSIPFQRFEETFRFKNKNAPGGYTSAKVQILATTRGPVVSDVLPVGAGSGRVVTVRWSAFEAMGESLGFERFWQSRTAAQFREALRDVTQICLNCVFADLDGHIGWHVTGRLPIREKGQGRLPRVVSGGEDDWRGWIPFDQMPHADNPPGGWVGTANHKTVDEDYPFYYSDFYSTPFRQQRLMQLMQDPAPAQVQAHWRYQRDVVNLKAAAVAPVMAQALLKHADTEHLGRLLQAWDHQDQSEQVGPTLFHAIFNEFARLVFADELGEPLSRLMLASAYYWEQRLIAMIQAGHSAWFDDVRTADRVETQEMLWHQAALNAAAQLKTSLGSDPGKWRWGDLHRYEFISPIARQGLAKRWLGGGSHPARGSGDTLCRAKSDTHDLTRITLMASLRMVVDMGDSEKVLAVLPGGLTGRQFDPHTTDQIESFINGNEVYWWFSDKEIRAHKRHELILKPAL